MNSNYLRDPGDLIAQYRIQRWLGAGAEGTVYVARDVRNGTLRTIKVLRGRNMVAEARHTVAVYRRLAAVDSVKRFIEWGVLSGQRGVGERPWLAFSFIRGRSLADCIQAGRIKNPLTVLRAVCDALAPIHRLGLAVGDFDEGRNLLRENVTRKIRFCDLDAGTPGFAAPTSEDDLEELVRLARRLNRSCDRGLSGRVLSQLASVSSVIEAQRVLGKCALPRKTARATAQPP
jgi:hypothetical protein